MKLVVYIMAVLWLLCILATLFLRNKMRGKKGDKAYDFLLVWCIGADITLPGYILIICATSYFPPASEAFAISIIQTFVLGLIVLYGFWKGHDIMLAFKSSLAIIILSLIDYFILKQNLLPVQILMPLSITAFLVFASWSYPAKIRW
jgi:hypothetical protein